MVLANPPYRDGTSNEEDCEKLYITQFQNMDVYDEDLSQDSPVGTERVEMKTPPKSIQVPTVSLPPVKKKILQQWEGIVSDVDHKKGIFSAELTDLTSSNMPLELADFLISDISQTDLELLKPGAVFYWSIYYNRADNGQLTRVNELIFRRAIRWTKKSLQSIKDQAGEWFEEFKK